MTSRSATELTVNPDELKTIVRDILSRARTHGADMAEAGVSVDAGLTVAVRLGEVETVEFQRDRGLGVTVYFGKRKGTSSTADLEPASVRAAVEKACSIARFTAEDEFAGLADPARMADGLPDLDLCHPWEMDTERAIELARACETVARDHDSRIINSEGASISTHQSLRVYGNSHGLVEGYPTSYHSASCAVVAKDDSGMERDYWYTAARDAADMDTVESVGLKAARRTVARLGSRKLSTRKVPVLYPAELARGLVAHFLGAISGGSQYRRSSFLLEAAGTRIFPEFVQMSERPHIPKAMGSAGMDNEGVATRDRELVTDGVLQGYILSSYSARKLGLETTGNAGGVSNLLVASGEDDFDGLLRNMGTGFLVTELIGQGVNPTTGDYSRGAAGFWVENGEICFPVHEVTVAGNLREMYRAIAAIGNDVDCRGKVRCGSILVEEMTVAGD